MPYNKERQILDFYKSLTTKLQVSLLDQIKGQVIG